MLPTIDIIQLYTALTMVHDSLKYLSWICPQSDSLNEVRPFGSRPCFSLQARKAFNLVGVFYSDTSANEDNSFRDHTR